MVGDGIDRISRWIDWGVDFEPGGVVLVHRPWLFREKITNLPRMAMDYGLSTVGSPNQNPN
jgi:hypothetical protein